MLPSEQLCSSHIFFLTIFLKSVFSMIDFVWFLHEGSDQPLNCGSAFDFAPLPVRVLEPNTLALLFSNGESVEYRQRLAQTLRITYVYVLFLLQLQLNLWPICFQQQLRKEVFSAKKWLFAIRDRKQVWIPDGFKEKKFRFLFREGAFMVIHPLQPPTHECIAVAYPHSESGSAR